MAITIEIDGIRATVIYDQRVEMYKGSFENLSAGANFYSHNIESLFEDGAVSLHRFFEQNQQTISTPYQSRSCMFIRVSSGMHQEAVNTAKDRGVSLDKLVETALAQYLQPAPIR